MNTCYMSELCGWFQIRQKVEHIPFKIAINLIVAFQKQRK